MLHGDSSDCRYKRWSGREGWNEAHPLERGSPPCAALTTLVNVPRFVLRGCGGVGVSGSKPHLDSFHKVWIRSPTPRNFKLVHLGQAWEFVFLKAPPFPPPHPRTRPVDSDIYIARFGNWPSNITILYSSSLTSLSTLLFSCQKSQRQSFLQPLISVYDSLPFLLRS